MPHRSRRPASRRGSSPVRRRPGRDKYGHRRSPARRTAPVSGSPARHRRRETVSRGAPPDDERPGTAFRCRRPSSAPATVRPAEIRRGPVHSWPQSRPHRRSPRRPAPALHPTPAASCSGARVTRFPAPRRHTVGEPRVGSTRPKTEPGRRHRGRRRRCRHRKSRFRERGGAWVESSS